MTRSSGDAVGHFGQHRCRRPLQGRRRGLRSAFWAQTLADCCAGVSSRAFEGVQSVGADGVERRSELRKVVGPTNFWDSAVMATVTPALALGEFGDDITQTL